MKLLYNNVQVMYTIFVPFRCVTPREVVNRTYSFIRVYIASKERMLIYARNSLNPANRRLQKSK